MPETTNGNTQNTEPMVPVCAQSLFALLSALVGAPHEIRELQATRGLPELGGPAHPIDRLIQQYNAYVEQENQRAEEVVTAQFSLKDNP